MRWSLLSFVGTNVRRTAISRVAENLKRATHLHSLAPTLAPMQSVTLLSVARDTVELTPSPCISPRTAIH